jgi:hypothetical protein
VLFGRTAATSASRDGRGGGSRSRGWVGRRSRCTSSRMRGCGGAAGSRARFADRRVDEAIRSAAPAHTATHRRFGFARAHLHCAVGLTKVHAFAQANEQTGFEQTRDGVQFAVEFDRVIDRSPIRIHNKVA